VSGYRKTRLVVALLLDVIHLVLSGHTEKVYNLGPMARSEPTMLWIVRVRHTEAPRAKGEA